jgi:ribosomal protein S27E
MPVYPGAPNLSPYQFSVGAHMVALNEEERSSNPIRSRPLFRSSDARTPHRCGQRPRGPSGPARGSLAVGSGTGVTGSGVKEQPPDRDRWPRSRTGRAAAVLLRGRDEHAAGAEPRPARRGTRDSAGGRAGRQDARSLLSRRRGKSGHLAGWPVERRSSHVPISCVGCGSCQSEQSRWSSTASWVASSRCGSRLVPSPRGRTHRAARTCRRAFYPMRPPPLLGDVRRQGQRPGA